MKEYLETTYGITVYQEQVMLLSQKLAGFSKGEADMLRKGMGKKQKSIIDALYPKFIEGGERNHHPKDTLDKVWKDWEAFASYAFNKSHSTCYAFVAFQTAYLKANYPAAFMAAVLTHNKNDISKITFFLQECKRMGVRVLGPNVNESTSGFTVNSRDEIVFGLSALKGIGEGAVDLILEERETGGIFESIFDLMRRVNLRAINKKVMEGLALSGAFDCFADIHRAQYFAPTEKYDAFIEHLLRYGSACQNQQSHNQASLFGAAGEGVMVDEPKIPDCRHWSLLETLTREKEVTGIFLSGHPLDDYRLEMEHFVSGSLEQASQLKSRSQLLLAGMVNKARHMVGKQGQGWGVFELEDYQSSMEFRLFRDDYQKFKHLLEDGMAVFIKAKWQKGWNGGEEELKIVEMRMLGGIAEEMTQEVTLRIRLRYLDEDMVEKLEGLTRANKGKHRLKLELIDDEQRLTLKMISLEHRISANRSFLDEIRNLGISFQLN